MTSGQLKRVIGLKEVTKTRLASRVRELERLLAAERHFSTALGRLTIDPTNRLHAKEFRRASTRRRKLNETLSPI